MDDHATELVFCGSSLTLHSLQESEEQRHIVSTRPHLFGDPANPSDDGRHFTSLENFRSTSQDQLQCAMPVSGGEEAFDDGSSFAVDEMPLGSLAK
jgi:hypothetical protein